MEKCKCYSLPYHDKFESNCSCECHTTEYQDFTLKNIKENIEKYNPNHLKGVFVPKEIVDKAREKLISEKEIILRKKEDEQ
jgi:hypothetical protein